MMQLPEMTISPEAIKRLTETFSLINRDLEVVCREAAKAMQAFADALRAAQLKQRD